MSSRSPCAVDITAKFIDRATKQHGGQRSALSQSRWRTLCGARHTRSRSCAFALERPSVRAGVSRSPSIKQNLDRAAIRTWAQFSAICNSPAAGMLGYVEPVNLSTIPPIECDGFVGCGHRDSSSDLQRPRLKPSCAGRFFRMVRMSNLMQWKLAGANVPTSGVEKLHYRNYIASASQLTCLRQSNDLSKKRRDRRIG